MNILRKSLLVLFLAACSDGTKVIEAPDANDSADAAGPADAMPDAAPGQLIVSSVLPWTGGGLQIIVEQPFVPGTVAKIDAANGTTTTASIAGLEAKVGLTAVVVVPTLDQAMHQARLAAAHSLLDSLPKGERVSIFVAGVAGRMIADFSSERAHAHRRIDSIAMSPVVDPSGLIETAQTAVEEIGTKGLPLARTVVVIGATVDEKAPDKKRPVQMISTADTTPAAIASVLSQHQSRRSFTRIGVCGPFAKDDEFTLRIGNSLAKLDAPNVLPGTTEMTCNADDAANDRFPFFDEIDLQFSQEQRAIYDQRIGSLSEELFSGALKFGTAPTVNATLHLRGQGSLSCARKNFSLEFEGGKQRLMPGRTENQFFLISMCLDNLYFGQVWGNRLLKLVGGFESGLRYVRLRIDGVNQGVYMLVERPQDSTVEQSIATRSVVRRRYDIFAQPSEVKFPNDAASAEAARMRFDALGDLAVNGDAATLETELDKYVDLDGYFKILAVFAILQNGDYIDEMYFYSSDEPGNEFYRTHSWDNDDLMSLCHGGGGNAISDRCNLTFCAEGKLDQALLRSEAVYSRYRKALADVIEILTPEVLQSVMDQTKAELFAAIDSDETSAAMLELPGNARTESTAEARIATEMERFVSEAIRRRTDYSKRLAGCQAVQAQAPFNRPAGVNRLRGNPSSQSFRQR